MNLGNFKQMDEWEDELDNINWKEMLSDIDQALMDNLAAELGFPSFERLEQASRLIVDQFYVTHLSDGRWAWWNPRLYAQEDPYFFADVYEVMNYIAYTLQLSKTQLDLLHDGLLRLTQTKQCKHCEFEFNPMAPFRREWDPRQEWGSFCSPECVTEYGND
ncbi:hypothetical protein [Hazenella coriacea]|uniref:Uncharacterized protein n=1 Tax=Hazenella coriacea TaxID=1179467 RepID=A0A4R3L533_9BACL|nr:hypothetical protein [Hazenella coriacea]TCS94901.1 hypothetical protein EDD58_103325 [Hazenella coriacea]